MYGFLKLSAEGDVGEGKTIKGKNMSNLSSPDLKFLGVLLLTALGSVPSASYLRQNLLSFFSMGCNQNRCFVLLLSEPGIFVGTMGIFLHRQ